MALPPGLMKHPKTGMYWIRRRVPKDVQHAVGRSVITETLETKDRAYAEVVYRERMFAITDGWTRWRASGSGDPSHRLLAAFAGEFYRSIVKANEEEPGRPEKWDHGPIAERRVKNPYRVTGTPGASVAREMHAFLADRGYDIGGRYREAMPRFYEAKLLAYRTLQRMARGDYSPDPVAPTFPSLPADLISSKRNALQPLTIAGDWDAYARPATSRSVQESAGVPSCSASANTSVATTCRASAVTRLVAGATTCSSPASTAPS